MLKINAKFKFHPVGQGAFYSSNITLPKKNMQFNLVYDCGSNSPKKLTQCIDNYKTTILKDKHIDVLIISHLDDDHVNGIRELLEGVSCKKIYMPYLTPFQRLSLALIYEKEDSEEMNDNFDYIEFLKSPHDYMFSISKAIIYYISGNSEENKTIDENISISEINELIVEFGKIEDDLVILAPESEKIKEELNENTFIKIGNNSIRLGAIWDFYLYNDIHDSKNNSSCHFFWKEEIVKDINRFYNIKINENEMTQSQLVSILENEGKFKDFKIDFFAKNYPLLTPESKKNKKGKFINQSSLMLLHKPLNYKSGIYKISKGFPPFTNNLNKNKILLSKSTDNSILGEGTLLTGDIGLTQITNSNYIRQQLKKIGVFQVPHHGSKVGWNKQKLKELNPNTFTIINFGFGNLYGHPNETVLQDLKNERFDIRFVNQFEHFEYEFKLIY